MEITQLKIFGERNSGTNWIEDVILKNYNLPLLHHRGLIEQHMTTEHRALLSSLPIEERNFVRASITDWIFENYAIDLFGWKHRCVDFEKLQLTKNFDQTGFIFMVRHPYNFIKSLRKKPYHALLPIPDNLDDFISSPWMAMPKDNVPQPLLQSPLLLWNLKIESYLRFVERSNNAIVVRYEDILDDFELLFKMITDKFSVSINTLEPINPAVKKTESCKNTNSVFNAHADLSSTSIEFMRPLIDSNLTTKLNYKL
jgi:hypothetical protein